MAQTYYNSEEAAEALGVSAEEIKAMMQRREIHGYRDGADWKFKVDAIDELVGKIVKQPAADTPDDEGDVLLSEVEFGASDPSASGTVIGMEGDISGAGDSDIQLASSEPAMPEVPEIADLEELDLTLEEDLSLIEEAGSETSDIGLAGDGLEDDDLVLGGSSAGSDITIGGDSGISLVDPADSGLSLEEPLELAGSGVESLELGEDDMIELAEEADTDAPTELKTDDDFLLTPLEEVGDDDSSESSSQVIALDTGSEGFGGAAGGMAAMLDEDLSAQPDGELGFGSPMDAAAMGAQAGGFADGAQLPVGGGMTLPEAPYSGWNIASLALCSIVLILCGMFSYDLLQNMWSWDGAFDANSAIMDWILEQFEG
ncbi:MAG: helix-turn-helix domain-containing protein [Candidatus Nealsonbacteria bacterium]|nr:helix-turn-helix domain-containing protein [Candidatus Nealsonbacteria bacterium]